MRVQTHDPHSQAKECCIATFKASKASQNVSPQSALPFLKAQLVRGGGTAQTELTACAQNSQLVATATFWTYVIRIVPKKVPLLVKALSWNFSDFTRCYKGSVPETTGALHYTIHILIVSALNKAQTQENIPFCTNARFACGHCLHLCIFFFYEDTHTATAHPIPTTNMFLALCTRQPPLSPFTTFARNLFSNLPPRIDLREMTVEDLMVDLLFHCLRQQTLWEFPGKFLLSQSPLEHSAMGELECAHSIEHYEAPEQDRPCALHCSYFFFTFTYKTLILRLHDN